MNRIFKDFQFIPITHILLMCTIATLATALAVFQNQKIFIMMLYAIGTIFCIILKKYAYLPILFLCLLFSLQTYFNIHQSKQNFYQHQEFLDTQCTIRATIVQKQINILNKNQATLLLQTIKIQKTKTIFLQEPKKIFCIIPASRAQKLHEGQTIIICNATLQQPKNDSEYQIYMIKEGIWANLFITSQKIIITNFARSWFAKCSTKFYKLLDDATINLFNPLFLGKREKSIESIEIQHQSLYWGIAHHMARSGIHLITLFGLFMIFFHYVRVQYFYRYLIGAIFLFIYFQISISSLSFMRALCMIMLQIICKIQKFQYSSIHALTLTTLCMIMYNPWYILFLDFQLSFGITAVIIWLFHAKWSKTVAFQPHTLIVS